MRNIIQAGEDFLNRSMLDFCSERVEYRTDGVSRGIMVNASIGKTFMRTADVSGYENVSVSVDFFIDSGELNAEPVKGDIIKRNGLLYEVSAPDNEACWRFAGPNDKVYRIHTNCIGSDVYYPSEV